MVKLGYKLMTEEHGPRELVRFACAAEDAGFEILAPSDHYHPWLEDQGHAPFVWSLLGAVAQATERAQLVTAVTCPILRYHPAVIAQAAATTALLSNGRFSLGLGSGERLNEHVVGRGWPAADIRLEMLTEAIEIMRLLWKGGYQTFRGRHLTVEAARVFDLPEKAPKVIVAAGGKRSTRLAAEKGDGMITTVPKKEWVAAYRKAGGKGPLHAEATICWARTREAALETARKYLRFGAIGGGFKVLAELPNVANFEAASERIEKEDVGGETPCGPDVEAHAREIKKYVDAGFDHVIVHQPGPDQEEFLRFWKSELAPCVRELMTEAA